MRAGLMLDSLARRFEVHLFVVPVAGGIVAPSDFVRERAIRVGLLDLATTLDPHYALIARVRDPEERRRAELAYPKPFLSRFCTGQSAGRVYEWSRAAGRPIAAIHVMRLYLAPLAEPFLRLAAGGAADGRPFHVLDLDDDEVQTRRRLAGIRARNGDHRAAAAEAGEERKYQVLANQYLPKFDRVLVCSAREACRLRVAFADARFAVVPNGYGNDQMPPQRAPEQPVLRLLFVGTFGYYPNEDAALFLGREILPALRRLTRRAVRVDLIGAGASRPVLALAQDPHIRLHGFVGDLSPWYAAADVAVVPVRAGGGTRIKILEAFAHRVPVVSTRIGAEGLDAVDGEHLLLADEADAFARACLLLKEDPSAGRTITGRAAALLAAAYAPERIDAAVAEVYQSVQARSG